MLALWATGFWLVALRQMGSCSGGGKFAGELEGSLALARPGPAVADLVTAGGDEARKVGMVNSVAGKPALALEPGVE